ncbi:MAG: TlyA family rRNA (cytidine-2'-O)-methyltransferase, partial [Anaerolineales bacterium]
EPVNFVTVDASFISLKILLPVIKNWFGKAGGRAVVLVKPQFEAGRKEAARGKGVIKDPVVHRRVLEDVLKFACKQGYGLLGLARSPLTGPKGNIEFLAYLEFPDTQDDNLFRTINLLGW